MNDRQDTARETAMADLARMIDHLEYGYLIALQQMLNVHIDQRRAEAIAGAKEKIRKIAASVAMTPEDILASGAPHVAYRDPATGKTWNGQGRIPKWLDGKRSQYRVQ